MAHDTATAVEVSRFVNINHKRQSNGMHMHPCPARIQQHSKCRPQRSQTIRSQWVHEATDEHDSREALTACRHGSVVACEERSIA